MELDNNCGAIKLTTSYYFLPSGQCIDRTFRSGSKDAWGVMPTVEVVLSDRQRKKCVDAWREVTRELVPPASQPATQPTSETVDAAAASKRLLEADLQLKKGYELLLERLASGVPAESPATTQPGAN